MRRQLSDVMQTTAKLPKGAARLSQFGHLQTKQNPAGRRPENRAARTQCANTRSRQHGAVQPGELRDRIRGILVALGPCHESTQATSIAVEVTIVVFRNK